MYVKRDVMERLDGFAVTSIPLPLKSGSPLEA
jgi:hypothetical protein